MSKIFVGIAVLPAGSEEYNVSVSLISSDVKWSPTTIGTKTSSSPVKITALTETVRSLIFSIYPEWTTSKIGTYLTSVPPALPADQCYDIFKALENAELLYDAINTRTSIPCNHGEAYTVTLSKGKNKTTALLTLDFSIPDHLCAASLTSSVYDRELFNFDTHELSVPVSFQDQSSLQNALKTIFASPLVPHKNLGQIVLITPPTAPEIDIGVLVANICRDVPVSILTPHKIAQAAAAFAHEDLVQRLRRRRCPRGVPGIPVSVATASGTIVPLANTLDPGHGEFFVILTNLVTNQKSVTVRLLVGNHNQARDNIQRAIVVLDGLNPLPKGHARIRVSIDMASLREYARVVQQRDGPKKTFLFPHFFSDLPDEDDPRSRRYDILVKTEKDIEFSPDYGMPEMPWEHEFLGNDLWSRQITGTLPE